MLKIRIRYRGVIYRDQGPFDEVMSRLRRRWEGRSLKTFLSGEMER